MPVNVQCKENAAAMHLCNKTMTDQADAFPACGIARKCRYFGHIAGLDDCFGRVVAMSQLENYDIVRRKKTDK